VGTPPGPLTVAENVTGDPPTEGFADDLRLIEAAAGLTTMVTGVELATWWVLSPP
jgi:hypothetical protein